ncbi:hypothetical protein RhiirA4_472008 [Rhizophagus irregularis]|uniref:Uncharacterized protein n=1 Tax=Rhizophagus irregularis TaxID=588596 RepID=A0A2I1H451_9GLOM|nr:hypothetical protein RhiirA4_472008 [Rhizophagus irregularis]
MHASRQIVEGANVKNSEPIIGQTQNYYLAFPKNESDSDDHERKYRQNSPQKMHLKKEEEETSIP